MSELLSCIDEHRDEAGALMPVLHAAQDIYGYLPAEVQTVIDKSPRDLHTHNAFLN